MIGSDFIAVIQQRLGNRTDITAATILREAEMLRSTTFEHGTFWPWFLKSEDLTISTVLNQEFVNLPTGFLAFDPQDEWSGVAYQDPLLVGQPDPWVDISLDDFNVVRNWYLDTPQAQTPAGGGGPVLVQASVVGRPMRAGLIGSQLFMRPIPDNVYPLRFRFYKTDSAFPSDSTTNLWLTNAPDWVIGEVGFVMSASYTKDMETAGVFDKMRVEARRRCYNETVARAEYGKARQQGDD